MQNENLGMSPELFEAERNMREVVNATVDADLREKWEKRDGTPKGYRQIWLQAWMNWGVRMNESFNEGFPDVPECTFTIDEIAEHEANDRMIVYVPPEVSEDKDVFQLFKILPKNVAIPKLERDRFINLYQQSGWLAVDKKAPVDDEGHKMRIPTRGELDSESAHGPTINTHIIASLFNMLTTGTFLDSGANYGPAITGSRIEDRVIQMGDNGFKVPYETGHVVPKENVGDDGIEHQVGLSWGNEERRIGEAYIYRPRKVSPTSTELTENGTKYFYRRELVNPTGETPTYTAIWGQFLSNPDMKIVREEELKSSASEGKGEITMRMDVAPSTPLRTIDEINDFFFKAIEGFDLSKALIIKAFEEFKDTYHETSEGYPVPTIRLTDESYAVPRTVDINFYPSQLVAEMVRESKLKFDPDTLPLSQRGASIGEYVDLTDMNHKMNEKTWADFRAGRNILDRFARFYPPEAVERLRVWQEKELAKGKKDTKVGSQIAASPTVEAQVARGNDIVEIQARSRLSVVDFAKQIGMTPASYFALASGRAVTLSSETEMRIQAIKAELEGVN